MSPQYQRSRELVQLVATRVKEALEPHGKAVSVVSSVCPNGETCNNRCVTGNSGASKPPPSYGAYPALLVQSIKVVERVNGQGISDVQGPQSEESKRRDTISLGEGWQPTA